MNYLFFTYVILINLFDTKQAKNSNVHFSKIGSTSVKV
jgi:hypothetical protein